METIDELLIQQYEMLKSMDGHYLKQLKTLYSRLEKQGFKVDDSKLPKPEQKPISQQHENDSHKKNKSKSKPKAKLEISSPRVIAIGSFLPPLKKK